MESVAIIGFGEAGRGFAAATGWGRRIRAYDCKIGSAATAAAMRAAYEAAGVQGCDNAREAMQGARAVLSLVTADQALTAAQRYAAEITRGTLWLDMNSVAPATKREAAEPITAAGGVYVDVAVMAPAHPALLDVPILVSGAAAGAALDVLERLGFTCARRAGDTVGRAATIKLLRSVIVKGLEALTAECVLGCAKAGVLDEVLHSLGVEWPALADYRLDRMMAHGARRGAEMQEAAATLEDLGVTPLMTRGTIAWQQRIAATDAAGVPEGLPLKLARLSR